MSQDDSHGHHTASELQALLALAHGGDRRATDDVIRTVHELYGGSVLCYLRRHTGDSKDAEALLWQSYLKLWQAILRREQEWAALKAFLYRIAHGELADYHRLNAYRLRKEDLVAYQVVEPTVDPPDDAMIAKEALERAFRSLPQDMYDCLVLHHFHGFSYPEIIEILKLQMKPDTVRKRIASARQLLRAALESHQQQLLANIEADEKGPPHT